MNHESFPRIPIPMCVNTRVAKGTAVAFDIDGEEFIVTGKSNAVLLAFLARVQPGHTFDPTKFMRIGFAPLGAFEKIGGN